jgi:predicted amidohydrolase
MQSNISRRKFLGNASMGMGAFTLPGSFTKSAAERHADAPGNVNVGTVSTMDISAADTRDMVQRVLGVMDNMIPNKPDIICLPEGFGYSNLKKYDFQLKDVAEKVPGSFLTPFMNFAAKHKCYVICPTYTSHSGSIFISAVLIDRKGNVAGVYDKMRPAESELKDGVRPGKNDPPVFQTDFGKIGIQICFDIKYEEGWNALKDKGAQIIFWPSAYAAGREISSRAWRHQVYIVSSTQKDTSKICDITGETLAETSRWQRNWITASINTEKAFILAWPAVSLFPDIQKKYGSAVRLTTYGEEEWTIIESLDKNIKVADVLKEYKLKTMHQFLKDLDEEHNRLRV